MKPSLFQVAWLQDVSELIVTIDYATADRNGANSWRRSLLDARDQLRQLCRDVGGDSRYAEDDELVNGLADALAHLTTAVRLKEIDRSSLVWSAAVLGSLRDRASNN